MTDNQKNTYVAIMAGGVGSRFWPGSREARPKQFLDILGVGKTLLQLTYERCLLVCPKENVLILTNKMYQALVLEQLPDLTPEQILCEPSRNNTAPCLAYTAYRLQAMNPNAKFVVASSDHIILNTAEYARVVNKAIDFVGDKDALMTIGLRPSRPDTGYGYIKMDATATAKEVFRVAQFMEKPNLDTAIKFLASGEYSWNAGIFVWKAADLIAAFAQHAPDIHAVFERGKLHYNTPTEQAFIDEWYPTTPSISIDYAILEKADNIYTIPADFGWSDLGTWTSLHAECEKDANDNVLQGDVLTYETSNSIIRTYDGKMLVIKGLENFIVIDEPDVLLICPKDSEQEIKQITTDLKNNNRHYIL